MLVGLQSPKILVFHQVKSPNGSILRRGQDGVSFLRHELDVCNGSLMIVESCETKGVFGGPAFNFAVIATCSKVSTIW